MQIQCENDGHYFDGHFIKQFGLTNVSAAAEADLVV